MIQYTPFIRIKGRNMFLNKISKILIIIASFTLFNSAVNAMEQRVIHAQELYFWTETFGNPKDPALVLIIGSGGQGLLWPQAFCEKLAKKGLYVIRYDNRDVGLSSAIDYKKTPYTLLDMAKDVNLILEGYGIKKAHIVGASMGGQVGMLFAAHFPEKTKSLTLCVTSPDMRVTFDAFAGKETTSTLSKPSEFLINAVKKSMNTSQTIDEKIQAFIDNTKLNYGPNAKINEKLTRELAIETILRSQHNPEGPKNHFLAVQASFDAVLDSLAQIKAPTRIVHGDQDPIFGLDHAKLLNKSILNSKLVVLSGLGHGLPEAFYAPLIENITENVKAS